MRRPGSVLAALGLSLAFAGPAAASSLLSTEEALALAFPDCALERKTLYLTEAQLARARAKAGVEVPSGLVHAYVATCAGQPGGVALFDTHRVRTQAETLLVALEAGSPTAGAKVKRLEIVAFAEPPEYVPRFPWYQQFVGRELSPDLALGRGIRGVTGATLTARATSEAVRRVLALVAVLREDGAL